MMLLLLKVFGVKRVAGWALRLVKIIVWVGLAGGLGLVLWFGGEQAFERMLFYGVVGLVILGLRALWRRRHKTQEPEAPQAERTIDGKLVPDKLAMAAFAVPSYSSDGDYVLRGLPEYGKALLKLDGAEFAYVPEPPGREPKLLELTVVEPATPDSPFAVLRWVGAVAVVVCLVVAGVVIQSARSEVSRDRARIQDMAEQASPQPVVAAEIGQGSTPAPPQVTLTPPPAPVANTTAEAQNAVSSADSRPGDRQAEIRRLFGVQGGEAATADSRPSPAEAPEETWRDPSTGLLWPKTDNGSQVISRNAAMGYCARLSVGGLTGWRLPTLPEIETVWDGMGKPLRGGIQQNGGMFEILWSSSLDGTRYVTKEIGYPVEFNELLKHTHALCVHD